MATNGALGTLRFRSRQNSSISPMTSMPAARALTTGHAGFGWVSGTPGASTSAAKPCQSAIRRSSIGQPAFFAAATMAGLSSNAAPVAPPATNASTVARPLSPRPKTATFCPRKLVTGIIAASPEFQRRQADERQQHGNDPEADHDLRLGPAERLEMMMNRCHAEDALAGQLERGDLDDHRHSLQHKQAADDGQHHFLLGSNRDRAEHPAERQRAGVAHEDGGRRRIEPEET